jgi:hypothetical protein
MSIHKKLRKFSTAELEEELKLRTLSQPLVLPIEDLSWEGIVEFIEDEGVERLVKGKELHKDFEHSVFKLLMEELYGEDVWTWWDLHIKKRK